jgi:2,3-bisphosphoglycerate-independent phosphoglycerate mutase
VEPRGDAAARGRALQRDHPEVVRAAAPNAELPRAARGRRRVRGGVGLLRGLGRCLGLEPVETGLDAALVAKRLDAGDTFVYVHDKRVDEAGHTKDPRRKQSAVEEIDGLLADLPTDRAIVCVTGDHATPASPEVIHSGDPVPLVIAGPGVRGDRVTRFGELDCAAGILGQLRGPDLMPVLLNAADRPLFLGSRPTPVEGADGYPAAELLEPLT